MPNTKHLIELQILEKCEKWLLGKYILEKKRGYKTAALGVSEFIDWNFNADNNKEL